MEGGTEVNLKVVYKKIRSFIKPNNQIIKAFDNAWFYIAMSLLYILIIILAIKYIV